MRIVPLLGAVLLLAARTAGAADDFYDALRAGVEKADSTLVRLQGAGSWQEDRQALQLPVPYTLAVPVTPPPHARLRTALAVRDNFLGQSLVDVAEPTRFRVTFTPDGGAPAVLLDRVLDIRGRVADRRWIGVDLDLARFAGTHGTLAFRAETADAPDRPGKVFTLWGRPNLYDPAAQRDAPNLLILTIDALRADHLSCYGYDRPTSPVLDGLAREGIRYAHAFANAPMTMPSLAQFFTGAYFPSERTPTLLSSLFAGGVLATHAIIRNPYLQSYLSLDARDTFDGQVAVDYWRADKLTRAALHWIDEQRGDRFALWVHFLDTHTPYRTPLPEALRFADPGYRGPIGPRFGDVQGAQEGIYHDADRRQVTALYDGSIRWTDAQIGVLLDGLRQRGLLDRTLVVVTADHGEELWDHGSFFHGVSLYDELLHVPLIVRLPGGARAGSVVDDEVRLVDVVPTVTEVLRTPPLDGVQGASLLATKADATPRPVFARAANPTYPWRFGLRTPKHKLILTVDPPREELFDLVADPGERVNRIDDPALADVATRLRDGLATFRAPLDDSGVQLRAVAPPGMASVLEVTVTAEAGNQPLANPDRIGPLRPDRIHVSPDGRSLVWHTLVPDTPIGIRFDRGVLPTWRGEVKISFAARALGAIDLPPRALFLGDGTVHPAATPFTYEIKPGGLFGKPVETPALSTTTPPSKLTAFVGEPATLYVWRAGRVGDAAPGAPAGIDPAQREKLRALGYTD
jgi:arylsulfatase A-like enzyme